MKNIKLILTAGAALLTLCVNGLANVYTDTNIHNVTLNEGASVSGRWSYGPIGAGETITQVDTWFTFSSEDQDPEQFHIDLGTGEGGIEKNITSGIFNFGSSYTLNWNFNSGASLFADASNGLLSYVVTATDNNDRRWENDFTFNKATVQITTVKNSVPDGGTTIALTGLSFLGLVGVQRKFRLVR